MLKKETWMEVDGGVSAVAKGGNLDFEGNEVLGISLCCVSNQ